MGDMSFSGGFETMEAGKDKEGWIQVVSPSAMRHWLFIIFYPSSPLVCFLSEV
jgi:hypothetical protein